MRSNVVAYVAEVPVAVDDYDDFEEGEKRTEDAVETALANTVNNMRLRLSKDQEEKERLDADRGRDVMPGVPQFVQGGGIGTVDVKIVATAMEFM
jgi:hypothetical protein